MYSVNLHRSFLVPAPNVSKIAAAFMLALLVGVIAAGAPRAQAQSYQVIYNLPDGTWGGGSPQGGLILKDDKLYGTLPWGGVLQYCCGRVFELSNSGSGWTFSTILAFRGGPFGIEPSAIVFDADGNIYGSTQQGGRCNGLGCGTLFQLNRPQVAGAPLTGAWQGTTIYRFPNNTYGAPTGNLAIDQNGNLYGNSAYGSIYQLSPSPGGWIKTDIFYFNSVEVGLGPTGGVLMDRDGALHGSTSQGGDTQSCVWSGCGLVYQLVPSSQGWIENVLYAFHNDDGANPSTGVAIDNEGNLYGTTSAGGANNSGTLFKLTRTETGWIFSKLHDFVQGVPGQVTVDPVGNIYGTTNDLVEDTVYKVTPESGSWTYTVLHTFTIGTEWDPYGKLAVDANGKIYGITSNGGTYGFGAIFEIDQ